MTRIWKVINKQDQVSLTNIKIENDKWIKIAFTGSDVQLEEENKENEVTEEWSKLYITILSSAAPEIPPLQDPSMQMLRTTK